MSGFAGTTKEAFGSEHERFDLRQASARASANGSVMAKGSFWLGEAEKRVCHMDVVVQCFS